MELKERKQLKEVLLKQPKFEKVNKNDDILGWEYNKNFLDLKNQQIMTGSIKGSTLDEITKSMKQKVHYKSETSFKKIASYTDEDYD